MFKGFKAIVLCRVVCGDNSKVNKCGVSVVACKVINKVWMVLLVWMVLGIELWMVGK